MSGGRNNRPGDCLGFAIAPERVALVLGAVLLAQLAFGAAAGLASFDPRSALISGLSLCLLLRSGRALVVLLVCIGSLVVHRVLRSDVTFAFLAPHAIRRKMAPG